ncbi:3',5'-cyclic adenosine monophosphate phosphodiesterase CpdA [Clostridium puniceum]|uniref:3',5'-cyclic adenosine monophosphate phosphodiesterase CpdA n=1 Tax=Clostridium puniceum TaxID=29367 RepID=A0A1S8TE89_9CLOT|nr:metallophosphoesterase [Clostridium puniceum]OOM76026.1 3',5'-cyclic adenosine monophosphate phosphodiesterase CpdA [Clostridium puniceum]
MKKFRRISVAIAIILVGVIAAIYMNKPKAVDNSTESAISNEKVTSTDESTENTIPKKDLTFAVLGDVHGNLPSFQDAIEDLHNINPRMDLLVLNGDTVDQGKEESYVSIKDAISKNKNLLPKTIIKNIGNHEFYDYEAGSNSPEQVKTFINRYLEFAGEEKVYHDKWINDYHFISLGSEDGNSKTTDSVRAFISDIQQKWLKEKLSENYQKGKPIFVFLHQHLNDGNTGWIGVEQSKEVRKILSKYPEVILFTSHTHSDLNNSSILFKQPFTMIHTGAVSYTIVYDDKSDGGRRREPYIKGLYVEVDGNKVVVNGRDIKEKKWIFNKEISMQ